MAITPSILTIKVDPQPTSSQVTGIGRIGQLMDPNCVLIAQFRNDGWVMLYSSVLKGASYALAPLVTLPPAKIPLLFTFTVDVGTDPSNPLAGLLVERADAWDIPWDDEVAYSVGGASFPFGADPVPVTGSINPNVLPVPTLTGTFLAPPAGGNTSELTIKGLSRTTTITIAPLQTGANLSKTLSLWLPQGTNGSMDVGWGPGHENHSYTSKGILGQAAAGTLSFVETKSAAKKIKPKKK